MDLCAEMLARELSARADVSVEAFRPAFARAFGALHNANRLYNRLRGYPRQVRAARLGERFDVFHVVDHSYGQLLHALPDGRAGVFCHDLDTFRCLIEPRRDPRPRWFRWMARRILRGVQKAAVVFHATDAVRAEIERFALVDTGRLVKAPPGVAEEFRPQNTSTSDPPFVLHVGSCIPRKGIDVLLATFGALAARDRELRLVQVGGEWTDAQRGVVDRLGADRVEQRRGIDRVELAALYASARLVLLPSEAEGFGLPLIEAIACDATVLASDLPVLREVAGDAAAYAPVGDAAAWGAAAGELLAGRGIPPTEAKRRRASMYTWSSHAATIAAAYRRVIG